MVHRWLLLLLGSHLRVAARTPKCLALLSFILSLNTLGSENLHALTRTFGFFTFLVKRFLELMQHDLEVLDVCYAELGHVLIELSLFIIDLML